MAMKCGSASAVCRPATASFTTRNPVRARPQHRMRVVSMAAPELVRATPRFQFWGCLPQKLELQGRNYLQLDLHLQFACRPHVNFAAD